MIFIYTPKAALGSRLKMVNEEHAVRLARLFPDAIFFFADLCPPAEMS